MTAPDLPVSPPGDPPAIDPDCGRTNTIELDGVRVSAFVLAAGYRKTRHGHERSGLILGVDGRFEAETLHGDLTVRPAHAAVLPRGARHRELAGSAGARCMLVEVDEAVDEDGLDRLFHEPRVVVGSGLDDLARSLWTGLAEGRPGIGVEADAHELFLRLHTDEGPSPHHPPRPAWLDRAVVRLREAPDRVAGLADLAADADVSRRHLARTFRRHTGCSVGEFLRRVRVLGAADRLRDSSLPLGRIAHASGFADQSHMTRTFRDYLGTTPLRYRTRRSTNGQEPS